MYLGDHVSIPHFLLIDYLDGHVQPSEVVPGS